MHPSRPSFRRCPSRPLVLAGSALIALCAHIAAAQESELFGGFIESFRPKLSELESSCLYWIEFDLDAKKIDSDFFWNGGSDLFFKIEVVGDPRPIYSPAFFKNYDGGTGRAPFFYSWLDAGAGVEVTILDDDSGGRVLSLLSGESSVVHDYDLTETTISASSGMSMSASTTKGSVKVESSPVKAEAGVKRTTGNVKYTVVPYPDWLVQGEKSEVIMDRVKLSVSGPGVIPAEIEITDSDRKLGTASLWSHASNRRPSSIGWIEIGTALVLALSLLTVGVGLVKKCRSL